MDTDSDFTPEFDPSEHLAERGDLGFRLIYIRQSCEALRAQLRHLLEACADFDELDLGTDLGLQVGWALGALERNIAHLGVTLDSHCPDMNPAPSEMLASASLQEPHEARQSFEDAYRCLGHVTEVIDQVTKYLVTEIDDQLATSTGPDDESIEQWLSAEPQL